MPLRPWIAATRLPTVMLVIGCVSFGLATAVLDGHWHPVVAGLTVLTAVGLQLLTNLANDIGDQRSGVDIALPESRPAHTGSLSPWQLQRGLWVIGLLTTGLGLGLIGSATHLPAERWPVFLGLGAIALLAALTYTLGPRPYGYRGYGDPAVFLCFGLLAVLGTDALQRGTLSTTAALPAIAAGALATGVLNINNLRDITSDTAAGKQTLAARLGPTGARVYQALLIAVAAVALVAWGGLTHPLLLAIAVVASPCLLGHTVALWRCRQRTDFNRCLGRLVQGVFLLGGVILAASGVLRGG